MSQTEMMELPVLDFFVPVLADRALSLDLVGVGTGGTGTSRQIDEIEVAYSTPAADSELSLRTTVRRGWRMTASGAPHTIASALTDLGEQAMRDLLLKTIAADDDNPSLRAAIEEVMSASAAAGRRIPGDPWVCRPAIMEDRAYAFVGAGGGDTGFCVVADFGPVVMTGSGRATSMPGIGR